MIISPNTSQGHLYETFRYSHCNRIVPTYFPSSTVYIIIIGGQHYTHQKYWLVRQALTAFFF